MQVRTIFPHMSLRDLPCHETKKILFLHQVTLKLWSVVFLWHQQKSWIRAYLCSLPQYRYLTLTLSLSATEIFMGQEMMLTTPRSTSFMRIFQVVSMFSVMPAILIPSTYTDRKSSCSVAKKKNHSSKLFPTVFQKNFLKLPLPQ